MGSDLPDPCGTSLDKLSSLLDVSASSCTDAVLRAIPYLDELRIRIELAPDDDAKVPLSFQHISHFSYLKILNCVIVNPGIARPVVSFSDLEHLTNLSLSGLGCSWNEISKIGSLENLYVLKLKNYAFRGLKWDVEEATFPNLDCLVIEDTDMVDWVIGCEAFRSLNHLSMKHCYKLEKIHGTFDDMLIMKIEIFDCNPLCVEEMRRSMPHDTDLCVLYVRSTWEDTKD